MSKKKSIPKNQISDELVVQAVAAREKGLIEQAKKLFQDSLAHNPHNAWALFSIGQMEMDRDPVAAFQFFDRAVRDAPHVAVFWYARAKMLVTFERKKEALANFNEALNLDPNHLKSLNDSAVLLLEFNEPFSALERFQRIMQIQPDAIALSNIAMIHADFITDEALVKTVTYLEQLLAFQPDFPYAIGRLSYQRLHVCDWRDYEPFNKRVLEGVRTGQRACTPFPCMVISSEAAEHQKCANTYAETFFGRSPHPLWRGEKYQHKKIRIAYVSPDFGNHPVGQLIAGVLEHHDKSQFELFGISVFDNDTSAQRARLVKAFDRFVDAQSLGVLGTATLMHQMEIDIAVDLAGYTRATGSPIFAHRPAPIQINFLGYPGTLGVDFMDYIVADRHVIPPEHQCFYNEKVVYLPDAYLPTDNGLAVSVRTPSRSECGLPESGFVFCSFSHDHKIAPPMFDVWMRLLQQVPASVLWLMSRLATSESNLRREAQARGIAPERLIFATRVPLMEDHLARYQLADLFLDTHPYNAHTTTSDALLVGLPVLTLMGNAFSSRVAGSLLHAIGLPELITHSLSEYEALALQLARQPGRLAALKSKLAGNRDTYPLFNTDLFCRNLEAIFKRLYQYQQSPSDTNWQKTEAPAQTAANNSESRALSQRNTAHPPPSTLPAKNHTNTQASDQLLAQGVAAQEKGQLDQARSLFQASLEHNPNNPWTLYSLGAVEEQRNLELAFQFYDRAVKCAPHISNFRYARASILVKLSRPTEALANFDEAIALDPNHVAALINSGVLLFDLHRSEQALERFLRVLEIQPHADALSNVAMIYADSIADDALLKAITCLEQLVAMQPNYPYAIERLSYQKLQVCDWRDYAPSIGRVLDAVRANQAASMPIPMLVMSSHAADHQMCAQSFAKFFFPYKPPPLWQGERYQHQKIRIAYVSPDLGDHPVGQLMAGVLERHDKSQFEITGISVFENHKNAQRDRLAKAFDRFIDAQYLGVHGTATLMRQMEIDIAVDLAGYTRATGSPIFAHRPAPIQINFLGYPGTLGVDFMDYIVADRHVIPPEHQCFYNEKVVYLPDAYLPTDNGLAVSVRTPSRSEYGLPESGFVFCSFSHDHKIAPPMFDVWMRLLQQVPASVLWLMSRLATSETNLRKEAQARGIAPERLIFATRVPQMEDHLARYRLADLFLDTHPYNAHTTTSDALLVGLPVLTLMGNAFPSRVAGSLLHAIGLPELITHSLSEYESLALQLAREPDRLMALRAKLVANRYSYPLFNTDLFCRNLEAIFKRLYQYQQSPGDTNRQMAEEPAQTTANALSKRNSTPIPPHSSTATLPAHPNIQASDQLLAQGVEAQVKGLMDQAKSLFQKSLDHNPNNPWAMYSLGAIEVQRNPELAFQFYDRAVRCAPHIAIFWYSRATILVKLSRRTEALANFDEALALDPSHLEALNDSGVLLFELHRPQQALERFQRILQIQPHANALSNIASIDALSIKDDDLIRAVSSLEQLVDLQPDYPHAIGRLIYQKLHICDWRDYAHSIQRMLDAVRANQAACTPIPMLVMSNEAADHQKCAQSFARNFFQSNLPSLWQGERYQHKKIRVAYVSPDFGDHPVGQQMAGVLEHHDKSEFEIIGISVFDNHKNDQRDRLVKAFDRFVEAQSMGALETATLMHKMEIDIAVDLAGYTQTTGSPIFAHRPAPIQINFLGYPGTLGVDFMDYIVADRHVIPPEHQCFYNEKVVYLPDAYLPTDNGLAVSVRTPSRSECGLPESGFVFCSFSHDHKIAPPMFDVWMRLLQQVPASVLWLMSRLATSENNLRKEAQARGIAPERLIFATRVPLIEDHLARYRLADLFLDTHPYNAHTTTSDALMVGLPVLTLMGNAFPSRVAGSLLHAIGLPELITHSLSEYEALALQLARKPGRLAALKSKLAANRHSYPLFNTALFCRNLEAIFKRLYQYQQSTGHTTWPDAEPGKTPTNHTEPNLLMQAVVLQEQGRINEARAVLERCLTQNPQDPMALYSMGTILMKDNNLHALNFLTQAVSKATTYAPLWFAHGLTLERSGRLEDALNSYENALTLDPNFLKALINSCIVMQKLQRPQQAAERYQRIVELQNGK